MMAAPLGGRPVRPTGPDPYADKDAIKALVRRKREEWSKGREPFMIDAYLNLLFARGRQWIRYDRRLNRIRPAILPRGTPTPVTNRLASTMDAVISVFARVEPRLQYTPGSPDEPEDRATADVATRVVEVIEDEVAIRQNRQMLAAWVGYTGVAWLETGYDPDRAHGTVTIDAEQCQGPDCGALQAPGAGVCETCGGPVAPTTREEPIGREYVDVVSLFEMFFDLSVTDWTKQHACLREKSLSEDEGKRRWPAFADDIHANVVGGTEEWYADSLSTMAPETDTSQTARSLLAASRPANRVRELWYWHLPDATYPEGLLAVLLGKEMVVHAGPLPYSRLRPDGGREPFLPFVEFPQKVMPGAAFPKTVASDLRPKQAQRNRWESILESCGMRMGSPLWAVPIAANVGPFTGEPGDVKRYNFQPGMPAPNQWRIPGQGIPLSMVQWIEQIDRDFEELAATFDVIKGARPEGVSAGIALQVLNERGLSRYAPLFIQWETAWALWSSQAVEIFRAFVTEDRLRKIKGRNGEWEVQKFTGADLRGRMDVTAEAGSSMPRSTMVERAEVEQLVAMGALNLAEPETHFEILKLYGKTSFLPSLEADTKNAVIEDEAFEALAQDPNLDALAQSGVLSPEMVVMMEYPALVAKLAALGIAIPRVRAAVDDHAVHGREHKAYLKSARSQTLPLLVQALAERHTAYHGQLMIQQMQVLQGVQPRGDATKGFMASPPAKTQVMNTSSSPERMMGDYGEMERDMTAGQGGA